MASEETEKQLQKFVEEQEGDKNQNDTQLGAKITSAPAPKFPGQRSGDQISLGNEIGWQTIESNLVAMPKDLSPFYNVLQLANITRPLVID